LAKVALKGGDISTKKGRTALSLAQRLASNRRLRVGQGEKRHLDDWAPHE
jgi:hypothetical protein